MIYLDNAATTELHPQVRDSMLDSLSSVFGNPSSVYKIGTRAKFAVDNARAIVSKFIRASTSEIFFTSGGTESNNTVLYSSVLSLGVNHIISSKLEHDSVYKVLEQISKNFNIKVSFISNDANGKISLDSLEQILKDNSGKKNLVSVMHVNNELGVVNPIIEISKICCQEGSLFHSDCVQSFGKYDINLEKMQIDFVSASSHKIHGPKGVGVLYINNNIKIDPLIIGGSQERNMRGGTENVVGIVGFGVAVDVIKENLRSNMEFVKNLKSRAIDKISQSDKFFFMQNQKILWRFLLIY